MLLGPKLKSLLQLSSMVLLFTRMIVRGESLMSCSHSVKETTSRRVNELVWCKSVVSRLQYLVRRPPGSSKLMGHYSHAIITL